MRCEGRKWPYPGRDPDSDQGEGGDRTDGHFAFAKYISASDPHYRWWAETGPGKGLKGRALYHFCDGNSSECGAKRGRQQVSHVEKFRPITEAMVTAKTPSWMFGRSCYNAVQPYLSGLPKVAAERETGELPWASQEEEDDSSQHDSSEEDGEDLKEKVTRLKKSLAAAEKKAKAAEDRAAGGITSKKERAIEKKKKKSRKGALRTGDDRDKEKKTKRKKRKSQERAGDASRGRSGPGSARDKKKRHRRRSPSDKSAKKEKKKHKARQRERGSSSAEREGLFGDKGSGSFDESDSEVGGRHADRGPFGAAEVERFSGRKEADSSDESDFREAPAQNMATNQLRLTEYSQKHPGRLAERLLLKMHRESSLISVGAKVGKRQTPAAAMHYLQTMMLPSLGAKVNIRTGRELRTLVP